MDKVYELEKIIYKFKGIEKATSTIDPLKIFNLLTGFSDESNSENEMTQSQSSINLGKTFINKYSYVETMLENCGLNMKTEEAHNNNNLPEYFKKYTSNKSFNFNAEPLISNKLAKKVLVSCSLNRSPIPGKKKYDKNDNIKFVNSKNGMERNNKLSNNENFSSSIISF